MGGIQMTNANRVLLKMVYGSTLYGTTLPTSDKDYKAVYLPCLGDLLLLKRADTFRQSTAPIGTKHGADDVETEFVAVQTWLKDVTQGQTYALELLFAFGQDGVEQTTSDLALMNRLVQETKTMFLANNVKPMVGYALNMARQYGVRGERLASLETLLAELKPFKDEDKVSAVRGAVSQNKYIYWTAVPVGRDKLLPSLLVMTKVYYETITVGELRKAVTNLVDKYGHRVKQAQQDGFVDWKATYHALRVMYEANEYLSTKTITLPLAPRHRDVLLDVRNGVVSFGEVQGMMEEQLDLLDHNTENTQLEPWSAARQENFDDWLVRWMSTFYKL
jgi:hypothetical protein